MTIHDLKTHRINTPESTADIEYRNVPVSGEKGPMHVRKRIGAGSIPHTCGLSLRSHSVGSLRSGGL